MQTKYGFTKGLNQDFATDKRDPNSYYDALNIKVSTDTGLTTASITNELGNELLFKIPSSVGSLFTITIDTSVADFDPVNTHIYINTTAGNRDISSFLSYWYTIHNIYDDIMNNVGVIADIAAGRYSVSLYADRIVILGLSEAVNVYEFVNWVTVTQTISGVSNPYIVGMGTMRDWIVIFTTSGGTDGQIWKCKYNKVTEEIDNITLANELDPAYHLVYHGYLGFSEDYRVGEVISRYQDSTHGKIYFVDGNHILRHINILDPNSMALPLGALEMIPDVVMTQPEPTNITIGGLYKAGMVQYVYQLFNVGGAETTFSPASGLVHLTLSNDAAANSSTYKGTALEEDTGKAVVVTINDIDDSFEYLRLVSIFYETKEGSPTITVISEKRIPTTKTLTITDTGDTTLDVYTVSEYNGYGSRLVVPKTITTKNNFLLVANFTEEYFDIDDVVPSWDTRAYRHDVATHFMADVDSTNYSLVSETADALCTEANYLAGYKYKADGTTLGGEGTNISYKFKIVSIPIDDGASDVTIRTSSATNQKWGDSADSHYIDSSYTDVTGFQNLANPLNHMQLLGYTRGETYRFGIVLVDEKGRHSFVKWIADIRMPEINELDGVVTYTVDGTDMYDYATAFYHPTDDATYGNLLGVEFTVNNVPTGYKYKIVRVRREDTDKTILGQGLVGFIHKDLTTDVLYANAYVYESGATFEDIASEMVNYYAYGLLFKSPEICFINSINPREGDVIKYISEITPATDIVTTLVDNGDWYKDVLINKVTNCPILSGTFYDTVQDGIKVSPNIVEDIIDMIGYTFSNGGTLTYYKNMFNWDSHDAFKGTSLLLGTSSDISTTLAGVSGVLLANYTRDVELSRYGGRGYYERFNNTYISCGNLRNYTDTTSVVFGGDTVITYFDYLNQIFYWGNYNDSIPSPEAQQRMNVAYVPLESTVCTELRHGSCYSRGNTSYKLNETPADGLIQYPDGSTLGVYDSSYEDVYLYNTVYSAEPISKTYVPKPQYFTNNIEYDYKIIASEKHINGQLTDSWLKFLFNNYTEVNSAYGAINKLITHNNQIYFFQDNAYGIVSLNDRQLLKDESGAPLVLGTGGVLDSFKYISEKAGCKSQFSVVDTGDALYFFDLNNRKFMKYSNGQDVQLSDVKGLSSYFRNFDFGTALVNDKTADLLGIHGVFDPIGKRVLYTFLGTDSATVGYNQFLDSFESFYSYKPGIYCDNDGLIMSVNPSNNTEVYLHNVGNRGRFYGTYHDSSVTILANQQAEFKKVFTNLEYDSIVYDGVSIPNGGEELYNDTFDTIRMWNSYQDSGNITLTSPTNIRRRFRTWRYQLPKVSGNRLLDYHLFIKLSFTNGVGFSGNTSKVLRTSDIIVNHLIPNI